MQWKYVAIVKFQRSTTLATLESVSIASEFPLQEFEKTSKKYPISDDSLIKVHRQARMRDELNKNDDNMSQLQSLRLSYRYFPDDQQLFEKAFVKYIRSKRNTCTSKGDKSEFEIEKNLLYTMKQEANVILWVNFTMWRENKKNRKCRTDTLEHDCKDVWFIIMLQYHDLDWQIIAWTAELQHRL